MTKFFCVLILTICSGCVVNPHIPASMEVQSADLANEIRLIRQEFHVYREAAKIAAELEEDRETLDILGKALDKDIKRAHSKSIDVNKQIKDLRDK